MPFLWDAVEKGSCHKSIWFQCPLRSSVYPPPLAGLSTSVLWRSCNALMKAKPLNYLWWWLWTLDTKKKQNKLEETFPVVSVFHFLIYIDCNKAVLDYMLSYYLLSKYFLQCPAIPSWLCHPNGDAPVNHVAEISYVDAHLLTMCFLSLHRLKLITIATELCWSTPGWPRDSSWPELLYFLKKQRKVKQNLLRILQSSTDKFAFR